MPFEISWLVEGRVIFAKLSGVLNEQDATLYDEHICYYLNWGKAAYIHSVVDCTQLQQIPSFQTLAHMKLLQHPHLGWTVTIGTNRNKVVHMLMSMMSQRGKGRLRQVEEMDDALAFLQEIDLKLPDLNQALMKTYQQGIRRTHDVLPMYRDF